MYLKSSLWKYHQLSTEKIKKGIPLQITSTYQMEDCLLEAREELKRLEHIIYVSLKYTRTVDVILNALNRMVSTYDYIIEAFLIKAKEEGKIDSLVKSPALRAKILLKTYPEDKELADYIRFYAFLKDLLKRPHQRREEFRRHVTLIANFEKGTSEIKIDTLLNCEKYVHEFLTYARKVLLGEVDEE